MNERDITTIEYLLRQGRKALEMYSSSECKDIKIHIVKDPGTQKKL